MLPMTPLGPALRNYAELGRISNLPTCFSNVLVGAALAAGDKPLPWRPVAGVTISIILLYVGGTALNDVLDVRTDRLERPGRAIPSGRISLRSASLFAALTLAMGLLSTALWGSAAFALSLLLVVAIVGYDLLPRRLVAVTLLMGACRGLVYLVAAAAVTWTLMGRHAWWLAGSLTLYTVLLTRVARLEAAEGLGRYRWLAPLLPMTVLPIGLVIRPDNGWSPVVAGAIVLGWLAWTARHVFAKPPQTKRAVLGWLAGISLVDMYFLSLLDRPWLVLAAAGCFLLTVQGHRRIMGT